MVERETDPQNVAANISHDIMIGQQVMEPWGSFSTESQKARVRLIVERVEQVKVRQRVIREKLRLQAGNMV